MHINKKAILLNIHKISYLEPIKFRKKISLKTINEKTEKKIFPPQQHKHNLFDKC